MRPGARALCWALVAGSIAWWSLARPARELRSGRSGGAERLLGPFAALAADVQWVRVHDAMRAGRGELVLARAEAALALAPSATEGWLFIGRHLAFDRASVEREPDPERRRAWVNAALGLARRGEDLAREPAELAVWQGLVRVKEAEEGDLPWPGGARALLEAAVDDFERAAARGHPDALELAAGARRRLARLP